MKVERMARGKSATVTVGADPTVSVIVPLYNKARLVGRTLDSILAQTFEDFEVIVVDDGSTDGGGEFVAAAYPQVTVVRQANAGPGAARNRGLAMSRGQFVTFLDADDEWSPELLETAVETLLRRPECGAFTAAFALEPKGVNRWEELGFEEGPWTLSPAASRREVFDCLFAFCQVTAVYRRSVAVAAGGYHEDRCTYGEDVPFWLRILLRHPIYRHPRVLGAYNIGDSELGLKARVAAPIEPVLTAPEIVRDACPAELRGVLELWLAKHACRAAFVQLSLRNARAAAELVRRFPAMRRLGLEYLKLRLRLALASL